MTSKAALDRLQVLQDHLHAGRPGPGASAAADCEPESSKRGNGIVQTSQRPNLDAQRSNSHSKVCTAEDAVALIQDGAIITVRLPWHTQTPLELPVPLKALELTILKDKLWLKYTGSLLPSHYCLEYMAASHIAEAPCSASQTFGFVGCGSPEHLLHALRARFDKLGSPQGLHLYQVVVTGNSKGRGLDILAAEGLVTRFTFGWTGNCLGLIKLVARGKIEAWNLPLGAGLTFCIWSLTHLD